MLQKTVLAIAFFIAALLALTFGEVIFLQFASWFSWLTGYFVQDFSHLIQLAHAYLSHNWLKVIVAAIIAGLALMWVSKNRQDSLSQESNHKKIAIILAVLLGWLGAHRFYLGQVGLGILYLILFMVYAPLVVFISLIDAVRYAFMSEQAFKIKH